MEQPSEKHLVKMRTYAEKFAEKSGTYVHPDRSVTDVVVEGLARQTASKSSLHQCGNKLTVFPHLIPPDSNRIGIEK